MRLLYYYIVGNQLIYRVKGCVGETHFPQQTPPGRHPSHIQLITCLFLNRDHLALTPNEEEAVAGAYGVRHRQINKLIVPRHSAWRRRPKCHAKRSGAALFDMGLARPP
jgi:hypothetical protein